MSTTQSEVYEFEEYKEETITTIIENHERPWRSREVLEKLYVQESRSQREIGDRLGCSQHTVSRHLRRLEIATRDAGDAGGEAAREACRVERANYRVDDKGYERWDVNENGSAIGVRVHSLVAISEGAEAEVVFGDGDTVCHHTTGHSAVTAAGYVEVIGRDEHASLHENGSYEYDENGMPVLERPEEPVSDEVRRGETEG